VWLREFPPGYFALVMSTGIVAVAARLSGYPVLSWLLFMIASLAYAVLWVMLCARIIRYPRAVIADLASHERGPTFLTIVAASGVLGSQFAAFGVLTDLLPVLFWMSVALWCVLVYGFLGTVTLGTTKPDLDRGLNGAWLLLVVATESLSVLSSLLALRGGASPPLVFTSLAFYLLGLELYVLLLALILLRWVFHPMRAAEMDPSWWINMGAGAIATLAGAQLMTLPGATDTLAPLLILVAPFTVLLWATSTFWIPLLVIVFAWKVTHGAPRGYDVRLWSAVFPLGMYVVATYSYAAAGRLPFLAPVPRAIFWIALLAWALTFIGMWVRLLRLIRYSAPSTIGSPRNAVDCHHPDDSRSTAQHRGFIGRTGDDRRRP
jgi:tellurite resistance protein TehA-like permease